MDTYIKKISETLSSFILITLSFAEEQFSTFSSIRSAEDLVYLLKSDSFYTVILIALISAISTWFLSLATSNYTYMDRLWPILPPLYCWIISYPEMKDNFKLSIISILMTIWGLRLAAYFFMKGVYNCKKFDDFRWVDIKSRMGFWTFQIYNFLFIAIFQNFLLVLMTSPIYVLKQRAFSEQLGWTNLDHILATLCAISILGEAVADWQQHQFQKRKKRYRRLDFVSTGLFRLCRHPNYFFDMMTFVLLYLFSLNGNEMVNWSIIGVIIFIAVFQKSIQVSERILSKKYRRYQSYQKTTWKVIPNLFKL